MVFSCKNGCKSPTEAGAIYWRLGSICGGWCALGWDAAKPQAAGVGGVLSFGEEGRLGWCLRQALLVNRG